MGFLNFKINRAGSNFFRSLFLFLLFSFFSAHASFAFSRTEIQIKWLGHSCFLIKARVLTPPRPIPFHRGRFSKSRRGFHFSFRTIYSVLLDPYHRAAGYPVHKVKANAVVISHFHFDHDNAGMAPGAEVFDGLKKGGKTWNPMTVKLAPGIYLKILGGVYHDSVHGKKRGLDSIIILNFYGIRMVHLGDLGTLLSKKIVHEIGKVDVLMVPVGGVFTINGFQAQKVVKELHPRIVLPIHYRTRYTNKTLLPIHSAREFLTHNPYPIKKLDTSRLILIPGILPEKRMVYVLKPLSPNPPYPIR
jgi:L-ascorbate metabolism protein UlaG (beta-lactamase superfamily)